MRLNIATAVQLHIVKKSWKTGSVVVVYQLLSLYRIMLIMSLFVKEHYKESDGLMQTFLIRCLYCDLLT